MPIDNISIQVDLPVPSTLYSATEPFAFLNSTFIPHYNKLGDIISYQAELRNLRIKMWMHSQICTVTNSIHKFYHGSNHTDFTAKDLREAICELSDLLDTDISSGKIKSIEYGCNIPVDDPSAIYNRFVSYKDNPFLPQVYHGETFGTCCDFSNYVIKAYDKTKQIKKVNKITIAEKLLRFEIRVKNMAALHTRKKPIPIYSVSDLLIKENLEKLCGDAVTKYTNSIKNFHPDMTGFTLAELTSYARQSNPIIKEKIKASQIHTYRLDKNRYNTALKKAAIEVDEVGELLTDKFRQLINS